MPAGNQQQTTPSIPSRFKPPRRRKKPEQRGFGSTDKRFQPVLSEVPGPASYPNLYEDVMVRKSPSVSKKGFLSSKAPQRPDWFSPDTPGPGHYSIPGIGTVKLTGTGTAAFLNGQNGRIPFDKPHDYPGPLAYDVNYDSKLTTWAPVSLRRLSSASIRSGSNRESFLKCSSDSPGIGAYDVSDSQTTVQKAALWSKSTLPQRADIPDNKVPGPGQYSLDPPKRVQTPMSRPMTTKEARSRTSSPVPITEENLPYLGWNPSASHTFGKEKDTFAAHFGRLDLAALIPGPGAYSPLADPQEQNRSSAAFRSRSPQRESSLKPMENRPPGPMYYSPKPIENKKLFFINSDNRWI